MKTIEQQLEEVIENIGQEHSVLRYVYNNGKKFVPGVSPVYYSGPYFKDNEEIVAGIKTLLTGNWIASGEEVRKFEIEFARKLNQKYALMVNSGSSANLVMIATTKKVLKWNDGDEVITSVVGFPTTVAPIVQNNLTPVFVDIEMDSLNFDLNLIEEKITEKTKAIFLSPVLGNPPDMDRLVEICTRRNIILLLDDCDSLGSKWNGLYLNEYAYASSNSNFVSHHLTTFEGGMVFSNDKEFIRIARSFAWWGRSCFTESAPILTNNGVKNIKDVVVGDEVLTHLGKYNKVTELIRNRYVGKMINISAQGVYNFNCTENHPIYVNRDNINMWLPANEIVVGDLLLKPVIKTNHEKIIKLTYETYGGNPRSFDIELTGELMRLIGYYAAEGSSTRTMTSKGKKNKNYKYPKYITSFSFNKNETEYISDIEHIIKKYFNVRMYYRSKSENGCSIEFSSLKLHKFLKKIVPGVSYTKKLPGSFLNLNNELLKQFIIGMYRGDGSCSFQGYSISTTSESLYTQISIILNKLKIYSSLSVRTPDKHFNCILNGANVKAKHNLYNILIYKPYAFTIETILCENSLDMKRTGISTKNKKYFTENDEYSCHVVKNITKYDVDDVDVYNLEVEDDHSYLAYGVCVHNCHCVGAGNLLPNGACGNRFDKHLEDYDGIIDHKYVFETMGYNLKPLDFQGSIGLVQLKKFDEIHEKRISNKNRLGSCLKENLDVHIPDNLECAETSWFGVPIVCKSQEYKEKLVAYFEEKKIQTRHYFSGNLLLHPGYKHLGNFRDYPEANKVLSHVFFIGCTPQYTEEILQYIEKVIKEFK